MTGLMGAAVLVAMTLAASACGGGQPVMSGTLSTADVNDTAVPQDSVASGTVSSSRLILGGRVRCTATVSRSVQAGDPVGLTFSLRNVSNDRVKVPLYRGGLWLVVRAADGTTYDTRVPLRDEIGPMMLPTTILPGTTKTVPEVGKYLRVRRRGPLQVTPGCGQTALPAP